MIPKISIIVPVYNAENFLERCVESILGQTFGDIELVLVDDGSKDSSGSICESYAAKDRRVHVLHKENGGESSARNAGLDAASGEWIGFVDSDDWIDAETYEAAYNIATRENVDIVQWGYVKTDGAKNTEESICRDGRFFEKEFPSDYIEWFHSVCNKLVRKSLLKNHDIKFANGIKLGEDMLFSFCCYMYAVQEHGVFGINKCFYYYFQNPNSITHSIKISDIESEIKAVDIMEKTMQESVLSEIWQNTIVQKKIETKNKYLMCISPPEYKLWHSTFPELDNAALLAKRNLKTKIFVFCAYFRLGAVLDAARFCLKKISRGKK